MSTNLKSVTTLKEVVANVMNDLGVSSDMGNYVRYLQFAIRIYKNYIKPFHIKSYSVVKLRMSDINTIDLPDDYVKFVNIGYALAGRMVWFSKDHEISDPLSEECGVEALDSEQGEDTQQETSPLAAGPGVPGGVNEYYYKVDAENNRIIIYGLPRTWIWLVYTSTGIKMDGDTLIPGIAEEAMIAGVHMLAERRNGNVPMNLKLKNEDDFDGALEMLRNAQKPTLDELYNAIYETIYQSIKR